MAYQLERDETLPAGIRRIVLEQLEDAAGHLTATREAPHTSIHSARQCFKRVRAVLCLTRDELGKTAFAEERHCFRDAGRRLAAARDAEVVVETLEALAVPLGCRLYAERPSAFISRIETYWRLWRTEEKARAFAAR